MDEINVNEVNENEVTNEVYEDDFEEATGSNNLVGLLAGVAIGALSTIAYKKLVKPAGLKIKERFNKSKEIVDPVIENVEVEETEVED